MRGEYNAFGWEVPTIWTLKDPGVTILQSKRGKNHRIELVEMKHVLMVCMGNICRSPMAETVGRKLASDAGLSPQLKFDSAGTHAHSVAMRPDPRADAALLRRGYELGRIRSRRVVLPDFQKFDFILAMDLDNLQELQRQCPPEFQYKLRLLLDFADGLTGKEVPDPYYGNDQGFERVLDLCEAGCKAWVDHLTPSLR